MPGSLHQDPIMNNQENAKNLRFNFIVNLFDGGIFGLGIGFASFATVIPLFIDTMTDSAVLIGLIPAIHNMGWQLPQLLVARRISRLTHYKPLTLILTLQERLPFLGLTLLAYFLPKIGPQAGLVIAFLLLIWQGLGAGFTANPWQILVMRVFPSDIRATFFGAQSAVSNLLASGGAIIAGIILERVTHPSPFAICFAITSVFMILSWFFLAQTREPPRSVQDLPLANIPFWTNVIQILREDHNFRWYLVSRTISQFAMMASAFYTVYAVRYLGMSKLSAGVLTTVLLLTQVVANPILGRIADRQSRKQVLAFGAIASGLSALLAFLAPSIGWFYPVIILHGIANTAYWTIGMAITLEFGREEERPTYVGMANTLIAPATILAPFLGGLLADSAGYQATFLACVLPAAVAFWMLERSVKDPVPAAVPEIIS